MLLSVRTRWALPLATALALIGGASAATADATGVTPATVTKTLPPGASTTIEKTVTTPQILPKPDLYFLADTTGSMGPAIANVKANATSILTTVAASASSPEFGAGEYKDFPFDPFAYKNDQAITPSQAAVTTAINVWTAGGGGDAPEANLFGLHRLVTDAGFRADSSRIVVWFGDAPGHDPVCSAISHESGDVTEASVTTELKAAGIKVIAVSVTTGLPGGLNGDPVGTSFGYGVCGAPGGSAGQADRIAAATGGQSFTDVDPKDVSAKILEGLKALPVTVKPVATCDAGLSATFTPASATVTSGDKATFTETLTVAPDAPSGASVCTVDFLINGKPAGPSFVERNTITVNRPPDCSKAAATPSVLWPPNHKLATITVTVPDPDSPTVTTTITGITQDEPLNAAGDGTTTPDAFLVSGHSDQVQLRAERSGTGDGRVYRVSFTADDGAGGTCTGTVFVGVPHDQSGPPAVDSGLIVNSLG